jgi:hypothetical protein
MAPKTHWIDFCRIVCLGRRTVPVTLDYTTVAGSSDDWLNSRASIGSMMALPGDGARMTPEAREWLEQHRGAPA